MNKANVFLLILNLMIVAPASVWALSDWWHGNTVRIADERYSSFAGGGSGQGAITLFDRVSDKQYLDIGAYEYGWTMNTPHRIEFHPGREVSVSSMGGLPRFQVRDRGDTEAAVWINGDKVIGSQFGPLAFAFGSYNSGWNEIARFESSGDLVLHNRLLIGNLDVGAKLAELESRIGTTTCQ